MEVLHEVQALEDVRPLKARQVLDPALCLGHSDKLRPGHGLDTPDEIHAGGIRYPRPRDAQAEPAEGAVDDACQDFPRVLRADDPHGRQRR
jgi:hypothetical protein